MFYTLSGVICAIAGILMLSSPLCARRSWAAPRRVTTLDCRLGGVDPFLVFGRVVPVVIALAVLQVLATGRNLLEAKQHLFTAVWGCFWVGMMIRRWGAGRWKEQERGRS